jgi:hypothetical protein
MSKRKKTVALKIRNCKVCNNGYYIALYHEKHTNDFIRLGSNCACEKSEISDEHVADLRDEMLHPEKYAPSLFGYRCG